MKFALLAVAFVASTVNAGLLFARQIRPEVQLCVDDIDACLDQLVVLTQGITDWTVASGYLGALAVQAEEQELEGLMQTAQTDCCVDPGNQTATEDEAQAVLQRMANLMPLVQDILDVIINRQSDFAQVPLVTNLVVTDMVNLRALTEAIADCLLNVTPPEHQDEANYYYGVIEDAFDTAYAAYGLT